jgi:hypothetical protein
MIADPETRSSPGMEVRRVGRSLKQSWLADLTGPHFVTVFN